MKTRWRQLTLLVALIATSIAIIAGVLCVTFSRRGPFTVSNMAEIPCAARILRDMHVSPSLEYVQVRKYRNDEFYVCGTTTRPAVLDMAARHPSWHLYNAGENKPLEDEMVEAAKMFPGPEPAAWLTDCLLLMGFAEDDTLVSIAFHPVSGRFCARLSMTGFVNRPR